jgi:hypothetical protein
MPGDVTVPKELDSMLFIASQPVEHATEFETVTVIPTGSMRRLTTIIHMTESGEMLARAAC